MMIVSLGYRQVREIMSEIAYRGVGREGARARRAAGACSGP